MLGKILNNLFKEPTLLYKFIKSLFQDGFFLSLEKVKIKITNGYFEPTLLKRKRNISIYNQELKSVVYEPFVSVIVPNYNHAKFLNKRIDSILEQTYKNLFYSKTLEKWRKLTCKDNLIIRHYSTEKFVNNNIVDDFLTVLNIAPNQKDFIHFSSAVNESYTKSVLEYKRLLNIIMPEQDGTLVKVLQKYSKEHLEPKSSFLTYEEKNEFNTLFKKDNELIQNIYKNCNFSSTKIYTELENQEKFKTISDEKIYEISNYIWQNNTKTWNKIKEACLKYKNQDNYEVKNLIDFILKRFGK